MGAKRGKSSFDSCGAKTASNVVQKTAEEACDLENLLPKAIPLNKHRISPFDALTDLPPLIFE